MEQILFSIKKIIPRRVFVFFQPAYHFGLAFLAAFFNGFPSRGLTVIGVTGTDGKSSVVALIHEIFRGAGVSVASASSLRFKINDSEETNLSKMTMPGRFFVQSFLRRAAKQNIKYVILEVTSEGIKQFRHKFIKFDAAVLTNLTPEHIESHGSFEKYREAKAELFRGIKKDGIAVINSDDPSSGYFSAVTKAKRIFYGKKGISIDGKMHYVAGVSTSREIAFAIDGVSFHSNLFGAFNLSNILAAVATAHAFGLPLQKIADAFEKIAGIPGRLEIVVERPFRVVVDYAHTPNALKSVYGVLKDAFPSSPLICVLGAAGGGRDKWKRPELGKIAGEFCDKIIFTDEDPYDESPSEIIDEVAKGVRKNVEKILDRREAIYKALRYAKPGDTVIITGKGAEQCIVGPDNMKIPWDDRKVVREELERLTKQ